MRPTVGRLADGVNRRNLIACGVLLWSAATIASGLAAGFWSFFAARIAVGLGEAALFPAASSLIIDLFSPRRRATALGLFSLGGVFGIGAALFVGGLLLRWINAGWIERVPVNGDLVQWRQLLVLAGLPGIVLPAFMLLIPEPVRRHSLGILPLYDVARRLLADNGTVARVCMVNLRRHLAADPRRYLDPATPGGAATRNPVRKAFSISGDHSRTVKAMADPSAGQRGHRSAPDQGGRETEERQAS